MRAAANCACRWQALVTLYFDGIAVTFVARGSAGSETVSRLCLSGRLETCSLARRTTDFFGIFAMYAPTPHRTTVH